MRKNIFSLFIIACISIIILIVFQNIRMEQASSVPDILEDNLDHESNQASNLNVNEIMLPLENSEHRLTPITHVMIHYMSSVVEKPNDPFKLEDAYSIFLQYNISTHYIIDREGNIYQLVPEDRVAYHAGTGSLPNYPLYDNRMNHYSIGIELMAIGPEEEMEGFEKINYDAIDPSFIGFTDLQYQSLQILLEDIHLRYPHILLDRQHIIGHNEYAPERKQDPGELFEWEKIGF